MGERLGRCFSGAWTVPNYVAKIEVTPRKAACY